MLIQIFSAPPQTRERTIHVLAPTKVPTCSQISPLYMIEVVLPLGISDCLSNENHDSHLLHGQLRINYKSSSSLIEPSTLCYLKLLLDTLSQGLKVRVNDSKPCILRNPKGGRWIVRISEQLVTIRKKVFEAITHELSNFSVHGVCCPVGKHFYSSGGSDALISDPDYGRVRSLTPLETWSLQGGPPTTFPGLTLESREMALLTTTPLALQVFMTGLGIGRLAIFY